MAGRPNSPADLSLESSARSIDDILEVARRRGMFFRAPERFSSFAAYLMGVQWADPAVLYGFQAYVSMSFEADRFRGWVATIAYHSGLEPDVATAVIDGRGSEEANAVALDFLGEQLSAFAEVARSGEVDCHVADYLAGGGRFP